MAKYTVTAVRISDNLTSAHDFDTIREARQHAALVLTENKVTNWYNAGKFADALRVSAPATFIDTYTFTITRK